jgi:hypothetical protein
LRKLAPASLILFGSTLDGNFVLDTVFVVKDSWPFMPSGIVPYTDDAFRVCTIEALRTDPKAAGKSFSLYRGATFDAPVSGLYSFVPCRQADSDKARFPRPSVSLPQRYLNPKSWRGPSGAKEPRSVAELSELWEKVRQQVLDAGCLLGVSFSTPRLDNDRRTD